VIKTILKTTVEDQFNWIAERDEELLEWAKLGMNDHIHDEDLCREADGNALGQRVKS
jgi:hypothetical protein